MCRDEHALLADPQWWMNTLVEWPAISSRLIPWLMALNVGAAAPFVPSGVVKDAAAQNVSGALFWTDDVWAGGANGWVCRYNSSLCVFSILNDAAVQTLGGSRRGWASRATRGKARANVGRRHHRTSTASIATLFSQPSVCRGSPAVLQRDLPEGGREVADGQRPASSLLRLAGDEHEDRRLMLCIRRHHQRRR